MYQILNISLSILKISKLYPEIEVYFLYFR